MPFSELLNLFLSLSGCLLLACFPPPLLCLPVHVCVSLSLSVSKVKRAMVQADHLGIAMEFTLPGLAPSQQPAVTLYAYLIPGSRIVLVLCTATSCPCCAQSQLSPPPTSLV